MEAELHASGETWQAVTQQRREVTQQRREVEAKINQDEAALEALRASNDDRSSHSKKWPAEVSASEIEVMATVKPAEIEHEVTLCKDLLKAQALHLAMIFSKPLRPIGAAADGSQQSQSGSRAGRLFFM